MLTAEAGHDRDLTPGSHGCEPQRSPTELSHYPSFMFIQRAGDSLTTPLALLSKCVLARIYVRILLSQQYQVMKFHPTYEVLCNIWDLSQMAMTTIRYANHATGKMPCCHVPKIPLTSVFLISPIVEVS